MAGARAAAGEAAGALQARRRCEALRGCCVLCAPWHHAAPAPPLPNSCALPRLPALPAAQQQQQPSADADPDADAEQEQALAAELAQLPDGSNAQECCSSGVDGGQQQLALVSAGLQAADAETEAAAAAALIPPGAFPWEPLVPCVGRLVQRGRSAGWLAEPAEVRWWLCKGRQRDADCDCCIASC